MEVDVEYKTKEWLSSRYVDQNKTLKEISEESGISISCIHSYIKKYDLKRTDSKREEITKNRIEKQKNTCIEKYGADNPMKNNEVKERLYNTNLERYGVKHALQNKDSIERFKKTCLDKFGYESPMQNEDVREKLKNSFIKKYGVDSPLKNSEIMKKVKKTNLKKYGVEHPSQNKEISKRQLKGFLENKGFFYEGEFCSKKEFCNEKKVSHYWFTKWILNQNNYSDNDIDLWVDNYCKSKTNIEDVVENKLNIKKWDKSFDKYKYPSLKYRPDFKLSEKIAINVDGLYWHNENNIDDKEYHFNMRREYEDLGLRIFQFRADEIENKIEIIRSIILNVMLKTESKIYARKTKIKIVDPQDAVEFLEKNHLMGSFLNSNHLGLYFNEELVMILSYRVFEDIKKVKIDRLCSKINTSVIGGFGKLLKKLESNLLNYQVEYWVDLRYGTGSYLDKFGFKKTRDTLGWKWTDNFSTYNRLRCRANMDKRNLSQAEYAKELGWVKIYDAGQRLYIKNIK
jgi:very-short-patch-repair endonuclease